ncbi:DNA processing protein [Agromyces terreus]|uniref:DNA processing protein n=1 Tax=Agromyces terreus TaxID=424795 RepID=A0A9X2H2T8_9MICO|nr:DNA-processing protein DprA [Agromyces terreus]MCP2372211.1 DNA processing protein [Agromyces terreus]
MSGLIRRAAEQWRREFALIRKGSRPAGEAASSDAGEGDLLEHEMQAFARAVLGTIGEPGDGVLGRLIAAVGAIAAADLIIDGADAARLVSAAAEAGEPISIREARSAVARWAPRVDQAAFARGLAQAQRVGATLLVPTDRDWPRGVDDLGVHAPIGLWVRGRPNALANGARAVALVGARAATGYGEHMTMEISAGLVDRGCTIVSGGAYGIDGMAHRAALAGNGTTVAYLAGGIDRFYPMGHDSLLQRISETGAVVSELPCGASPTKWRFLQRNRLIAAASDATVVLEAGTRSGSLNTAGHAAALGRPLGALPGAVTSPASAGCHRLLREYGALCVVDADQVLELAGGPLSGGGGAQGVDGADAEDPETIRVLDALSRRSPRQVADLAQRSGLPVTDVMAVLGPLELDGVAAWRADGWIRRGRP